MRKRILAIVFAAFAAAACGKGAPPPAADLQSAVGVVGYLASSRYVSRSMYSATAETGQPSEFVDFLFSSMGAAERPESAPMSEISQPGRGGPPLWPEGVAFRALAPDARAGRQVVIRPDDARGLVIAEAYARPGDKPVLQREFTLAKPAKRR